MCSEVSKLSVLIVDDSPENLGLLNGLLKGEACEVRVAPNGRFALRSAISLPPDLILLDIRMPIMDGLEVCRRLKQDDRTRDIPVIFLTALDSIEDEERGLMLGAVDYIVKPFRPGIVKSRIRNHLRYIRQRKLLEQMAKLDSLTEIPNRRHFDEVLNQEWHRALRAQKPLTLAMIDVDFFKLYNDSLGHPMGDSALIKIARTLTNCLTRSGDQVARYGGEEFAILLPDTDGEGAGHLLNEIRKAVEALGLSYPVEDGEAQLTVSIGSVTQVPTDHTAYSELVKAADANLYQAKQNGRNRVVWSAYEELQ
jgi:diguanylate cyclase (GGDEF)-like protein